MFYEIFAGLSVLSGVLQAKAENKAAKEQRKAQKLQTAIEAEQNRKAAVQTLRESRIKAAMIAQSAQNTGALGSGEEGALGSIQSQTASSIGFQRQKTSAAEGQTYLLGRASRAQSQAGMFQAGGNVFDKLYQVYKPKI